MVTSSEINGLWKNWDIGLETSYDIDELICILQQFEAIMMGYGMDFTVQIIEEEKIGIWVSK